MVGQGRAVMRAELRMLPLFLACMVLTILGRVMQRSMLSTTLTIAAFPGFVLGAFYVIVRLCLYLANRNRRNSA